MDRIPIDISDDALTFKIIHELVPYSVTVVVIDANIVFRSLIWMSNHPGMRPWIIRLMDNERIVVYAPAKITQEVSKYYPSLATKTGLSVEELDDLYRCSFARLRLLPDDALKEDPVNEAVLLDSNDVEYVRAVKAIDPTWFLSHDTKHLSHLAPKDSMQVILDLRDYHHAEGLVYLFNVGTASFAIAGMGAVYGVYKGLEFLARLFAKAPTWVKVLAAGSVVALFASPRGRQALGQGAQKAMGWFEGQKEEMAEAISALATTWSEAQNAREEAFGKLSQHGPALARTSPHTAKEFAVRAVAESPLPLSLEQITERVLRAGYKSTNPRLKDYLHRVLRGDPIFYENADGRWTVGAPLAEVNGDDQQG